MKLDKLNLSGKKDSIEVLDKIFSAKINKKLVNGVLYKTNANFKVTSISGDIVYEGFANGGQAIWNGKTKNNVRVATGIYLVLSADENGIEKIVSKIVFIK